MEKDSKMFQWSSTFIRNDLKRNTGQIWGNLSRDGGISDNLRGRVEMLGQTLPAMDEIGSTDLPKSGGHHNSEIFIFIT